jgi:hypothetical protein
MGRDLHVRAGRASPRNSRNWSLRPDTCVLLSSHRTARSPHQARPPYPAQCRHKSRPASQSCIGHNSLHYCNRQEEELAALSGALPRSYNQRGPHPIASFLLQDNMWKHISNIGEPKRQYTSKGMIFSRACRADIIAFGETPLNLTDAGRSAILACASLPSVIAI